MKISQIYKTLIKKELEDCNIIQQKDNNENNLFFFFNTR